MRDAAVLELLYATAIRVSELCELDTGGIDRDRRTVRVLGKGRKERVVPVGLPAMRALARWEEAGRPVLANGHSGAALFLGARGGRLDPRTARRIVHARLRGAGLAAASAVSGRSAADARAAGAGSLRSATRARTPSGIPPRRTCLRVAPTCAACRRSSAMPRRPPRRSTPTSRLSDLRPPTVRPTRAPGQRPCQPACLRCRFRAGSGTNRPLSVCPRDAAGGQCGSAAAFAGAGHRTRDAGWENSQGVDALSRMPPGLRGRMQEPPFE